MPLSAFHPIVARWFSETLGRPTAAQEKGWTAIRQRRHTLIAAPTGSGKTLAAFLTVLDDLVRDGLRAPLPDEVRVVYVSPLKALSADIHKNLAEPRRGIRRVADEMQIDAPRITAAVRTGDTTAAERSAMLRRPPHILVTTPESLYLLLTAGRSREMLRTVRTVIVDEIHAVIGTRRGAHLALSLERLQHIAAAPLLRLGLSATQKPVEDVARFLVGAGAIEETGRADCAIVDEGHIRQIDVGLELPRSPLEAVMSHEVWEEYYDRLTDLIRSHRTTLVFVNTRRMAERLARHLTDRLGEEAVTAHHGSLSKDKRLDAETRLKAGGLRALVATASLELGIDIGSVDLVCQIGSPHRIATFLQRVGRSGHTVSGISKGRLFPVSRDDLVECAALLRGVRRGGLDAVVTHDAPLDVLAQQVVAESASAACGEDELFALVRRAWPYRALDRRDYDSVVTMVADGFATKRGRRGALVHRDEVHARLHGRRGTRLLALSSGGAIPEVADYRVVLDPDDTFIGTLNEDFAIESMAGDVFQLGNASWRVLQVGAGVVRVADAKGAPPTIPFWFGEAPARSNELSRAVSDLRADVEVRLTADAATAIDDAPLVDDSRGVAGSSRASAAGPGISRASVDWLSQETGVVHDAAQQALAYLADAREALGVLPTQETLVLERFFDESGGMQLVLHAPFGSRINKAWGLALRKRFCRQFNFELQAAATEDAVLLSLGPHHSFPLADVFRYLHPATVRDVLVQAFLDAPVFQTRWRWNTTISLAVPRNRGARKVPPPLQRMLADDLLAAVFPDAAACLENMPGDRQIPNHPLVNQTVRDCLEEAMDVESLVALLERIHTGAIRLVARDTSEPSPLSHEILTARPYAFLDDAPLEERRTQAVYARRATEPGSASDLGALDAAAIDRVRDEQRPDPRDHDELHDVLLTTGFLTGDEASTVAPELFLALTTARRAAVARPDARRGPTVERPAPPALWIAAERLPELRAVHPDLVIEPAIDPPAARAARTWTREDAVVELLRGRMTLLGPVTARALADSLAIDEREADGALLALEAEGAILRGSFEARDAGREPFSARVGEKGSRPPSLEWCDRRLLARIHRYTLNRLRAEIEPVSPADFMRFLFVWQHVHSSSRLAGIEGLRSIIEQLDGFELAADAWERSVLPARVDEYEPSMLDMLCLTGEVGWARLSVPAGEPTDVGSVTPIALFRREHADAWRCCATSDRSAETLTADARQVLTRLRERGASFGHELAAACSLDDNRLRSAFADLVAAGLVASDGFGGLRWIVRAATGGRVRGDRRTLVPGRWSALPADPGVPAAEAVVEAHAWTLLRRYGVVFRRVIGREPNAPRWRDLVGVYRRLEARGEIRGGRFVSGMSGEQFALAEAVGRLREVRRTAADGRLVTITAVDPLNLAGIITAGDRVRAVAGTRIVYRDGVPIAAMEGDYLRSLSDVDPGAAAEVATVLAGRRVPAVLSGFVGRS